MATGTIRISRGAQSAAFHLPMENAEVRRTENGVVVVIGCQTYTIESSGAVKLGDMLTSEGNKLAPTKKRRVFYVDSPIGRTFGPFSSITPGPAPHGFTGIHIPGKGTCGASYCDGRDHKFDKAGDYPDKDYTIHGVMEEVP